MTAWPTVSVTALGLASFEASCHLQVESIERFTGPKSEVLSELAGIVGRDETVLIACHNEGERERLGGNCWRSPGWGWKVGRSFVSGL